MHTLSALHTVYRIDRDHDNLLALVRTQMLGVHLWGSYMLLEFALDFVSMYIYIANSTATYTCAHIYVSSCLFEFAIIMHNVAAQSSGVAAGHLVRRAFVVRFVY